MLVLTRKVGEKVIIGLPNGERVVITLVETRDQRSRLGFEAPRNVAIHRQEVFDTIQRSQEEQFGNGD